MENRLILPLLLLATFFQLQGQKPVFKEILLNSSIVYFDFGEHALRPDADSILVAQANQLMNKANLKIRITAHTDSIGSFENNKALSQRRADAVKKVLLENGFSEPAFQVSFFGEVKAVSTNRTDAGRQLNRRATIEVFREMKMTNLEGTISDSLSGKGIEAEVVVHTKFTRDSTRSDTSGYFKALVPEGEVAGVEVYAEGYFYETRMLKLLPGKMPPLKFSIKPALPGEKVDIQNLYFVGGMAILLDKSKPELPKVLRFMQVNWNIRIEIAGHVNWPNKPPAAKNTSEYRLSLNRALVVYNYLLENGIPAERIRYAGYANWEMVYPKAVTMEHQALNRRVEIRILKN